MPRKFPRNLQGTPLRFVIAAHPCRTAPSGGCCRKKLCLFSSGAVRKTPSGNGPKIPLIPENLLILAGHNLPDRGPSDSEGGNIGFLVPKFPCPFKQGATIGQRLEKLSLMVRFFLGFLDYRTQVAGSRWQSRRSPAFPAGGRGAGVQPPLQPAVGRLRASPGMVPGWSGCGRDQGDGRSCTRP